MSKVKIKVEKQVESWTIENRGSEIRVSMWCYAVTKDGKTSARGETVYTDWFKSIDQAVQWVKDNLGVK